MSNSADLQQLVNGSNGLVIISQPYTLDAPVDLNSGQRVQAVGAGLLTIANPIGLRIRGKQSITLEGIKLDGAAQAVNNFGIYIENSSDVTVRDKCSLTNMKGFGIFITANGGQASERILIDNVYAQGLGNNDVIGGGPADSTGSHVRDVRIINSTLSHDCTDAGYDNIFDIVRVEKVKFMNNTCYGRVQFGTEQSPNVSSFISYNNISPAVGKTHTVVLVTTTSGSTTGNKKIFINHNEISQGCIKCVGTQEAVSSSFIIDTNIIEATSLLQGIELRYLKDSRITNNIISNAACGIWLDRCNNMVRCNNGFFNMPLFERETY